MTPDQLRTLPGGSGPIPSNGSWGGSPLHYYPAGFVHPGVGNPDYIIEFDGAWLPPLTIGLTVLTSLVVATRITSRSILRTIGVDDWLIIFATLSTIAVSVILCMAVAHGGIGKHWYDITWAEMEYGSIYLTKFLSAIYVLAIFLTKLSILFFLRRVFNNTRKWMNRVLNTYIVVNSIFFIVGAVCLTLYPTPKLLESLSGLHLFLEIAILILPMRMVWRLNIPSIQRIIISLVLALGGVVCVISTVRLHFIVTEYSKGFDRSYKNRKLYLYAFLECQLGVLTASAPSIKTTYTQLLRPSIKKLKIQWADHRCLSPNKLTIPSEAGNPYDRSFSFETGTKEVWGHVPEPERVYNHSGVTDDESEIRYQELESSLHTAIELGFWSGVSELESQKDVPSRSFRHVNTI